MVRYARSITCLLLLIVLPTSPTAAAGEGEDPIAPAREAVEEGRYNDAVLQLTETLREDAEQFERAEPVYEDLVERQHQYADLGEELNGVLSQMSGDVGRDELRRLAEEALRIIEEMGAINPDPSEWAKAYLADADYALNVSLDRSDAELIMDQALVLLNNGDRVGALVKYLEGFYLQRTYFEERNDLAAEIVSAVDLARQTLEAEAGQYAEVINPMLTSAQTAVDAITDSPLDIARISVQNFAPRYESAFTAEQAVLDSAAVLQQRHAEIESRYPEEIERPSWHTRLLTRFVFGRGEDVEEGMLVAIGDQVGEAIAQIVSSARIRAEQAYEENIQAVYAGDWDAVPAALSQAATGARLYVLALAVEQQRPIDPDGSLDALTEVLPDVVAVEVIRMRNTIEQQPIYERLAAAMTDALDSYRRSSRTVADLDLRRAGLVEQIAAVEQTVTDWRDAYQEIYSQYGLVGEEVLTRAERLEETFVERLAELRGYEVEIVAERATLELQPLESRFASSRGSTMRERYESAAELLENGVEQGLLPSLFYPDRALAQLEDLVGDLRQLRGDLQQYIDRYLDEKDYVVASRALQLPLSEARSLITTLDELSDQALADAARAREQMDIALEYEDEGRGLMDQAFAALEELEFAQATSFRNQGLERLDQSLDTWYRESLVSYYDTVSSRFVAELDAARRREVIADVGDAIELAERVLGEERVDEYESTLAFIEEKNDAYEELFQQPETSLETLIRAIQTYLEASGGRELVETDPSYPYLSTLLNRAKTFYDDATDGRAAVGTALSAAAVALLNDADDLLQLLFQQQPQNWEGRILKVRIDLALGTGEIDRQVNLRMEEIAEAQFQEEETDSTTKLQYEALYNVTQEYRSAVRASTIAELEDRIAELEELLQPPEVVVAEAPPPEVQEQARNIFAEIEAYGPIAQLDTQENQEVQALLREILATDPLNTTARQLLNEAQLSPSAPVAEGRSAETSRVFRLAQDYAARGDYQQAYQLIAVYLRDNPGQADRDITRFVQDLERRLGR